MRRWRAIKVTAFLVAAMWPLLLASGHALSQDESPHRLFLPLVQDAPPDPVPMVTIPGGSFSMGCDVANSADSCFEDALPLRTVTVPGFAIDQYEVTNGRYQQCVDDSACEAPAFRRSSTRAEYYGNPAYADFPVIYITWFDANAYCQWTGKRLPTEAEWEKAARGTADTRWWPWGAETDSCTRLNYRHFTPAREFFYCVGDTVAVGTIPANRSPYGVWDMAGNVWEWTQDWYDEHYYASAPDNNPQGPVDGEKKSLRGGGWRSPWYRARVPYRWDHHPNAVADTIGFRCVRDQ